VEYPDTHYARAPDGACIAYQVTGDGPIDVVWQSDWPGNIDFDAEERHSAIFFGEMEKFARLIRHDRRGIGLSSRNVALPNLETRVADTLLVLDAVGAERPVLTGIYESGSPNALLAATRPDRVQSMAWFDPVPRFARAPDYPWGRTAEDLEAEQRQIEDWGTIAYGRAFVEYEAARDNPVPADFAVWMMRASRNACTPDVALELSRIWYESDVRGVLPGIQVPTLIAGKAGTDLDRATYVASLIPGAGFLELSAGDWSDQDMYASAEAVRSLAGVAAPGAELDTVLAAVLFTDIVGSTEKQAMVGDLAWKGVVERHHAIVREALGRWRGRESDVAGDGFYATFDGPARAIRCAQEIGRVVRALGIEVRAGIHVGECTIVDGKLGGLTVSIGARVATQAEPSTILVTQTVKDLVAGSGLTFEDRGERELKGVPDRWRVYEVLA
jgi:class 3 adenylate cyclase/pimeloyl-ACP methyl ester carboxylesterase